MSARRFCQRGHELIPGETAYVAVRWTGREVFFMTETGEVLIACDGDPLDETPCKYGGPEEHVRLENEPGVGGTRVVGTTEAGRTLWQHRATELRCRECNRQRVAASRAKRQNR